MAESRLTRQIRRMRQRVVADDRGENLVEFAIVSILLCLLVFAIAEFGRAVWIYDTVGHLAREGARFAIVRGSESGRQANATAVQNYVNSRAAGMTGLVVTTTWPNGNADPGSIVQVQVSRPFNTVAPLVPIGSFTFTSTSRMTITY